MSQANPGSIIVSLVCKKVEAIQNLAILGDALPAANIVQIPQDECRLMVKTGTLESNHFRGFCHEQGMIYSSTRVALFPIGNEGCGFFKGEYFHCMWLESKGKKAHRDSTCLCSLWTL